MKYITTLEASENWKISERMTRKYCIQGRIPGAIQKDKTWLIPEDAQKPSRVTVPEEPEPLPPLALKLIRQKKKKNYHGLYDYVQINLTYCSCRMASNRLTRNQIETIFKKGKVSVSFEPMKVSDVIEALNHSFCVDYILDTVDEPLTQKYIKNLHFLLMSGTVDERKKRVISGQYRTATSNRRAPFLLPADSISANLKTLISEYECSKNVDRSSILDFHVRFERTFPFEDGNGRIGRLLMFKECLRHDVMPFIIDDKRRGRYLEGLEKWDTDRSILTEVVMEAQDRFDAQLELQKLMEAGARYQPAGYVED